MALLSLVDLSGTAGQSNFTFAFPYLAKAHIHVYLDGVETTEFSFNSDFVVHLTTPLAIAQTVRIQRITPSDVPIVDFVNGATLGETDLDASVLQVLYVMQETVDIGSLDTARSVRVPLSEVSGISEISASEADRAGKFLYFDAAGNPLASAIVGATFVSFTPTTEVFSGNASQTTFTLASPPGAASALIVAISGVVQRPAADFTVSGSNLIFSTAPPIGTSNIVVQQFGIAQAVGTVSGGGVLDGAAINVIANGGPSTRTLGTRFNDVLNVLDYGADKTGVADSTAALKAVALICDGKAVWFPSGTYKVTDTVLWAAQNTLLVGDGPTCTVINFQPTVDNKACFKFNASNPPYNIQVFCGIRNMRFRSSGNTKEGKVAVQIITNEEFWMENFRIDAFSSPGVTCVGIEHFGWQLNVFKNGHIYADLPISLRLNPWTLPIFLDVDGCLFEQLILAPAATMPCLKIEDGAFVTSSTFKHLFLVGGTHGVQWEDLPRTITGIANNGSGFCRVTTSAPHTFDNGRFVEIRNVVGTHEANVRAVATSITSTTFDLLTVPFVHTYTSGGVAYRSPGNSYQIVFDNCRAEQRDDTTKYSFYFDRKGSPLEGVEFRSCYMDGLSNGAYLRRTRRPTFTMTQFPMNSKTSIDSIAELQCMLELNDCTFNTSGALSKLVGYKQCWAAHKPAAAQNMQSSGLWITDTQDSSSQYTMDGTGHRSFRLTLVDDEVFNLQCGSGNGASQALIHITAHGATKDEGMTCFASTGTNVFKIAGTTDTAVADTDTDLCVYRSSSNIQVRNRLGETADILVTIDERATQDITATNLSTAETYTVSTPKNFTDIVITDAVSAYVVAKITTTSAQAGTFNTATAGATTSVYDQGLSIGTGTWTADGTVANVNTLLAGLTWTPHPDVVITNCTDNGSGKVRVTAPGHGYTSSHTMTITGVVGTTEANVSKVALTYINENTFDIPSVNFVNPYVSGGVLAYAGSIAALVHIINAKNQIVQGRKAIGPV